MYSLPHYRNICILIDKTTDYSLYFNITALAFIHLQLVQGNKYKGALQFEDIFLKIEYLINVTFL